MKKRTKRAPAPTAKPPADLFRIAFHNSPAMQTVTRAADRRIVEVNETFVKKMGYSREELIGKTALELKFWVTPEKEIPFREELAAHGFVRGFEVDVYTKSREIRSVLLSADVVEIDGVPHMVAAGLDITERKEAEAKLRVSERRVGESEARFSTAFRASPAMMAITRLADAHFVSVNEAFLRATGYAEHEVLEKTGRELQLHAAQDQREMFLRGIEAHGLMRDYEFVIRTKDGRLRTWLASGERTLIDGAPHLLSVALDITERKEAEATLRERERQLRESEALFSAAFHASPILLTIARLEDAKFVQVNDAFVRHTGFERTEILGRSTQELGLWLKSEERAKFFEQLKRDRVVRNFECEIRDRHGRVHAMLLSGAIIEINREPHLITFGLDMTEQRQAQRALRESESRVRALYESISAAVAVQDETGFLQINPASLKLFGTDRPEEILGRHPADFSARVQPDGEDSAIAAQRHMARAIAEGTHRFEWLGRKLDGTEFPVEVTLTALQLDGRPVLQAVILDLTERKRAEAELQHALEKERELNNLKSDFVALVSHEFRTPLEVIMSSADNLERYHERLTADKRTHLLRTIHRSVARMSDMMEEVLLLGRLESGATHFEPRTVDVASFCERLRDEMLSATAGRCPIELKLPKRPGTGVGDEAVLRHIFTNLLSNAVKYSEAGQPVELTMRREGDDAVFSVIDHGCGIPTADQARLFQAFHRGNNVRHVAGTGLGLVIVRRSVALHGGQIEFASTEGQGTTFTVRLPLFAVPPSS